MQVALLQEVIRKNCHDVEFAYTLATKRRIEVKNNGGGGGEGILFPHNTKPYVSFT
jgi:lipocalin